MSYRERNELSKHKNQECAVISDMGNFACSIKWHYLHVNGTGLYAAQRSIWNSLGYVEIRMNAQMHDTTRRLVPHAR